MTALAHKIAWQAPRPLWRGTTPFAAAPQILRFASDDFMDQIIATLTNEPTRISERIAQPETWRTPPAKTAATDMIQRVALPAPLVEAKRRRLFKSLPGPPPPAADPKAAAEALPGRPPALLPDRRQPGLRHPGPPRTHSRPEAMRP